MSSLWGDAFTVPDITSKVVNKLNNPSNAKKIISSDKMSLEDKLLIIRGEVERILGKYKDDTIVISTYDELKQYIDVAIENKIIAIDTETNNSLDALTCDLMGPCLYTPGMKNAYIPINHINRNTGLRLEWQLTEEQIAEQFSRFDNIEGLEIITANGKFDYKVLYCTVGWRMNITWDTFLAAKMLDENEKAGLKEQYKLKIDPTQEKYDIEHLFKKVEYKYVDPDLFALYAATDAYMTYKLYIYQKKQLELPDNAQVYDLYRDVELPILTISANMELEGICLDLDYCSRLKVKYDQLFEESANKLSNELKRLEPQITAWRISDESALRAHKMPDGSTEWMTDKENFANGMIGKPFGKTKIEQLSNPISLKSTTQLAVLIYDILKHPPVDESSPRTTDKEALEELSKDIPLCKLLVDHRKLDKLRDAFINTLPDMLSAKDGRLHSNFKQLGTHTGRFSSAEPNLQQIPSRNKEIRMMFCASTVYSKSDFIDNKYMFSALDETEIGPNEWKYVKDLKVGDRLFNNENTYDIIKHIEVNGQTYTVYIN